MRNKSGLKVLAISIAIVIVASSVALHGSQKVEEGITDGGGQGIISLMAPPFIIGVAGASPANIGSGSVAARAGTAFLGEEAGTCAYTKLTPPVNLTLVKTVFKTVEYECEDYIIGSVAVSTDESEDVHVYASKDGWLAAYYLNEEPFPKILKSMMDFGDNKLEDALQKVCDALWISLPEVNYYDFRYPNANKIQIVADEVGEGWDSHSFRFMIPKEVATNVSKIYWVAFGYSWVYLDGKILGYGKYGELTFAQPGIPGNIVPGTYYTIKVEKTSSGSYSGNGGILLIYSE